MTTTTSHNDASLGLDQPRRLTTETKASTKTTEFFAFVGMVLAVVLTATFYDGDAGSNADPFGAATAMRFVVYLTIGYMIARGLAKSGSRERYDA